MAFNTCKKCHLVLTLVIGQESEEIYSLSQHSLQSYAKRIGADFACIRERIFSDRNIPPHYSKLRIKEYLESYDRVLFLDCDVIVSSNTPNIFEMIPEDTIGVVNEGALVDRSEAISQVQNYLGHIESWDSDYFNSGVILVSKLHQDLFTDPEKFYLNWKARFLKYKIYYFDKKYNYFFHEGASLSSASSAYIVHFAGWGFQLPKTQEDSKHTYKYHQMKCFLDSLKGQVTIRINPEQLCLVSGFINKKESLRKFTISQENQGLVSYGPYIKVNDGFYKLTINFEIYDKLSNTNKQNTAFLFDIVSDNGNKIWYQYTVFASQKHIEFVIALSSVKDLEIRFYGTGVSFSINFIELLYWTFTSSALIDRMKRQQGRSALL